MVLMQLMSQPLLLLAWVVAIIVVLTVHEFSHAVAATALGDQTAKMSGRLTLNPLAHVSWLGFFMLILVGFGWGKPVPYNPYNLKYQRFGPALVSFAGPFSNMFLALCSALALKIIIVNGIFPPENLMVQFLNLMLVVNVVLALFNLLPFPPLDGSKILFAFLSDVKYANFRQIVEDQGPFILLMIIIADNLLNINLLGGLFAWVLDAVYKFLV